RGGARERGSAGAACGDGAERRGTRHGDRRGAARTRPVAELAEEVVTPTIPLAAWCPAARMDEARCEVAPVPCGRHSDGDSAAVVTERAVKTGFRTGPPLYAELTAAVRAPAVGLANSRERAGVNASRRDRAESESTQHGHRSRAARSRAVADLALVVLTPPVSRARGGEAAGVLVAVR